jgi:serine/threonine-protein kinase
MLNPGDVVGRYHIQRRLGHGGMGTLYLARDPVLERDVALKLFLGDIDAPGARERFVREARATAALGNPNIVTVYDYGDFESQPYIVMEYIHGETLAEVIRRRIDVPVSVKLRWLEELSAAVAYAHGSGVIHRDIKPANLMLDAYGRLKVLDFGISRMLGTLTTSATARVGTPGYCAPEQIQGGDTDHRSDLFSIGAVAYEVFSGAEPFGGENVYAITYRLLHEDPAPLSVLVPGLDPEIEPIVARALQKAPEARFQDGEELRQAFAAVRGRLETDTNATLLRYVPTVQRRPVSAGGGTPTPGRTPGGPPSGASKTAVATPPPEPRRTDRELVARQRVQQFQERLAEARRHLEGHRFDDARRACQEALKLDPGHPDARELIVRIDTESHEIANSPTMLHVPQRSTTTTAAPSGPQEIEATVVRPLPAQLRTPAAPPAPAPSKAVAKPAPSPAVPAKPSTPPGAAATAQWQRLTQAQRQGVMAGAAVVALLIVVGLAAALWPKAAPPTPRTVVFDAVPWAVIERIQNADGDAVPLPADGSTPMTLALVPGTYQVVVVGPPPQQERRTVPLTVGVDGTPAFPLQRFAPMTADEYFKDLLPPPAAPPSAEPAPESKQP